MRGVKSKIENVGSRGSLLQAPAGGSGADSKTTLSWGGRSSPPGPNTEIPRLRLEDELDAKTLKALEALDKEIERLPRIIHKLKPKLRWDP